MGILLSNPHCEIIVTNALGALPVSSRSTYCPAVHAGPASLSLTVFSCGLGLTVLLCKQAEDCWIKIPWSPLTLTTQWSWLFGSGAILVGVVGGVGLGGASPGRQFTWFTFMTDFVSPRYCFLSLSWLIFTVSSSVPSITPALPT